LVPLRIVTSSGSARPLRSLAASRRAVSRKRSLWITKAPCGTSPIFIRMFQSCAPTNVRNALPPVPVAQVVTPVVAMPAVAAILRHQLDGWRGASSGALALRKGGPPGPRRRQKLLRPTKAGSLRAFLPQREPRGAGTERPSPVRSSSRPFRRLLCTDCSW
jgi:hypothetical protein